MTTEQKIIKKKWVYSNWPDNKEVMHTDSPPPKEGKIYCRNAGLHSSKPRPFVFDDVDSDKVWRTKTLF
jgi:hypothetical protein